MKRASILLGPPLAFLLAAVVAWLAGPPAGKAVAFDESGARSRRHREAVAASSGDPAIVAAQFENEMLNYRAPPKDIHDSEGMAAALKEDHQTRFFPEGGMSAFGYSTAWAEESPVEMFAWLIHEGGSDFNERVNTAAILFETWAGKDMKAALAAVAKISDTSIRRQALASSLEVLCQSNPNRARELLTQNLDLFPPGLERLPFRSYGACKTTYDLLLSLSPGPERTRLLAKFLTSAARGPGHEEAANAVSVWKDAPETLRREWVVAGFSSSRENAVLFDGLENLDKEQVEKSDNPSSGDQFMEVHGPAWAKRDLAGALDWAQAHLKGKSRVERSAGLFEPAANQDFDTALRLWQALPESILKARAAGAISKGAPADRKAEVEALMQSLPERARDLAR